MPGLSDTLARFARYRRAMPPMPTTRSSGSAMEVAAFGDNPGGLRMLTHVPAGLPPRAPLVVVLHGCGQQAWGYAACAGWVELAERFGFALLMPEQRRANNNGLCFNWFTPNDITRGHGEAASMRAMIEHALTSHELDPRRVFVTGLSAGGAFANVMLATYPELFAAGAIIAGLPYGAVRNTQGALDLMHRGQSHQDRDWGELVRAASGSRGPWPRIALWHGLADTTVAPANATALARQWLDVHGLAYAEGQRDTLGPAQRTRWLDGRGSPRVELVTLPRLGHGTPISAEDIDARQRCGRAAPFIVETGLSSSFVIANAWGLAGEVRATSAHAPQREVKDVGEVIRRALQAAGLSG